MRIKILHIIESLGRGGAEILFANYINALPSQFINIVVYLREPDTLKKELTNIAGIYCLNYKGKRSIFKSAQRINELANLHKVNIIHSHLYWPTLLARLGKPKHVFLISSVHNIISKDAFEPNYLSKVAENLTADRTDYTLFVSEAVKEDYQTHIKLKQDSSVLYNFIDEAFYIDKAKLSNAGMLKLASVGNLRSQKNHVFLINCFSKLKDLSVSLDIYGEGEDFNFLTYLIRELRIKNVRLMGSYEAMHEVLKGYDAFVLASKFEGFCLAMVEAMAMGLPCILPDTKVLREISDDSQLYFEPNNEEEFISCIKSLINSPMMISEKSQKGREVASRYTLENHIENLLQIYKKALQ